MSESMPEENPQTQTGWEKDQVVGINGIIGIGSYLLGVTILIFILLCWNWPGFGVTEPTNTDVLAAIARENAERTAQEEAKKLEQENAKKIEQESAKKASEADPKKAAEDAEKAA